MNVRVYRFKNGFRKLLDRIAHPWPLYKKAGGISAVVLRADGSRDDLGRVSSTYLRRGGWKVGAK